MRHRIAVCFLLALAGCSRDEPIRVYTVPKASEAAKPTESGSYRMLGGIFPADDPSWFFKVSGSSDDLAPHAADIEKFLNSIRFPNGPQNAPLWELPAGWKTGGPVNGMVPIDETFKFGPADKPFVLAMSHAKGGLDPNLARWFGQVGLTYDAANKDKYVKPIGSPTPKGWFVDITGPKNPAAARGPMQGRM